MGVSELWASAATQLRCHWGRWVKNGSKGGQAHTQLTLAPEEN